jgi:hypothetical protein
MSTKKALLRQGKGQLPLLEIFDAIQSIDRASAGIQELGLPGNWPLGEVRDQLLAIHDRLGDRLHMLDYSQALPKSLREPRPQSVATDEHTEAEQEQ